MTNQEAKKVLRYLEKLTYDFTTKAQYDEMVDIMKIIEKEMQK